VVRQLRCCCRRRGGSGEGSALRLCPTARSLLCVGVLQTQGASLGCRLEALRARSLPAPHASAGDMVFLASDGVSDNFNPAVLKLAKPLPPPKGAHAAVEVSI